MTRSDAPPVAKDFHLRWSMLGAPQRPTTHVVEAMRPLFDERGIGLAVQLGMTPEFIDLPKRGLAVDWSEDMLRTAWPGDRPAFKAVVGDWLAMPLGNGTADMMFGDACLSTLTWPNQYEAFLLEVTRVLRPGGRLVLRCFVGPNESETAQDLVAKTFAREIESFGEFKLRFNMASFQALGTLANSGAQIHRLFDRFVPDRDALAHSTGWSIAEISSIDTYAEALSVHTYPTRREIAALIPSEAKHRFVETTGYPLAERCPLLVIDYTDSGT